MNKAYDKAVHLVTLARDATMDDIPHVKKVNDAFTFVRYDSDIATARVMEVQRINLATLTLDLAMCGVAK